MLKKQRPAVDTRAGQHLGLAGTNWTDDSTRVQELLRRAERLGVEGYEPKHAIRHAQLLDQAAAIVAEERR